MALRPYIVGNWKMNGTRASLTEARAIDRAAARWPVVEVGLAPPATLLHEMAEAAQDIAVGGQDCHFSAGGAHTGDISAAQLADAAAMRRAQATARVIRWCAPRPRPRRRPACR